MTELRYFGTVQSGKLTIAGRSELLQDLRSFEGDTVEVIIRKSGRRSNQQNRYYWSAVVPIIRAELRNQGVSMTAEQTHDLLKYRFLKIEYCTADGVLIESIGSTTKLSKEEFNNYIEEVRQWAAEFLSVQIPEPNEQTTIEL